MLEPMSGPPRLLVVDPSVAWPEEDGARAVVGDWPGESRVLRPALRPGDGPGPGDGYDADGIVVMGSRTSVLDELPWLRGLAAWLRPLLSGSRPLPVLGICFGHQLIGSLAGAEVGFVHPDHRAELGVRTTRFEPCALVSAGANFPVLVSHREELRGVPPGYRVVARRRGAPIDAIEHERLPLYGVQFHPEADRGFLERREQDASAVTSELLAPSREILARFRRIVLERSATGTAGR
jgi:GMP synthase-like glutamine amidotransferase